MSDEILDRVYSVIKESPHSTQSLLLFALIKTLDIEKGGHMYMLEKLKDMTHESRMLSYELMEIMASNQAHNEVWQEKVSLIETAIRTNS